MLLVLKEMLPTYHKWRYNTYGVQERIGEPPVQPWCGHSILSTAKGKNLKLNKYLFAGCLILELIHAILNLSPEEEDQGRSVQFVHKLST